MQLVHLSKEERYSIDKAFEYIENRTKKIRSHFESIDKRGDTADADMIIADASVITHNAEFIQDRCYDALKRTWTR